MPMQYNAARRNFVLSATQNWVLFADAAGDHGMVTSVNAGGRGAASAPASLRWCRTTADGATPADLTTGSTGSLQTTASGCRFCTMGTPPTIDVAPISLLTFDCNLFGGLIRYFMDPGEGWRIQFGITNRTQIVNVCDLIPSEVNILSTGVVWEE